MPQSKSLFSSGYENSLGTQSPIPTWTNWKRSTSKIPHFSSFLVSSISLWLEYSVSDRRIASLYIPIVSLNYVLTEILKTEPHLPASLVICLVGLTSFSTYILLSPAKSIALILDIINFNFTFKLQLLAIAAVNILTSFAFEKFAERPISRLIVFVKRWKGRRGKRRDYRSLPSTGN